MADLNFSVNPYGDTFTEEKNYHRILFKPSLAVQTRELNELQTGIQNQIKRFGQHVFVEGSTVLNSERFYDNNLITITHVGTIDSDSIVGKIITGATSDTTGLVKAYDLSTKRLIVSILTGNKFVAGEVVSYPQDDISINISTDVSSPIGVAALFSVNSGIIFVKGCFVYNSKQSIILSDFSNVSVGFKIIQDIISSEEDESLQDNAQGQPNFSAPGADRYYIDLELTSLPLGSTDEDYFEIARIENGELVFVQQRTLYSELEKELARRTFDESGNYTVRPFQLSFEDHVSKAIVKPTIAAGIITGFTIINEGDLYTSTPTVQIIGNGTGASATAVVDSNPASPTYQKLISLDLISGGTGYSIDETYVKVSGDSNKFSAKLEPGKAYVKGFEFETTSPTFLTINKARSTEFADNTDVQTGFGNFVYTKNMFGLFDINSFVEVELHNVVRSSVTGATTKIGTAKVRFLDFLSGTIGSAAAIYKMYLFDIKIDDTKFFKDTESIVIRSGATVLSGTDIDLLSKVDGIVGNDVFLSGTDRTSLVFPLNHIYVKELRDEIGVAQNDYTFKRVFTNVSFTAGSGSISTGNGLERFVGGSGAYSVSNIQSNYHFVVTAVGTSGYTVGQVITPTSATGGTISPGAAQNVTFDFGVAAGFTVTIIASINANAQLEKTKSLQPYQAKIISTPNQTIGDVDSIGIADIYDIKAIYNTGTTNPTSATINVDGSVNFGSIVATNVTENYDIDNGQREDFYDHGSIILNGTPPGATDYLLIVYNYFTHTNNGFASVGSYSIPYEQIPTYTNFAGVTLSLADCVDFRPRRADNATTLTNGQIPDPDVQFQTDYSYYVGRIDRITANASKSFSVKEGIPATIPKVPTEEQDGMTLYIVEVPPYTESLSDITVKYVENKRYTMRDIGNIEKRVENLEYYTQLSLLEKQAKDESITDSSNFEKFKNGFFVDSFSTNNSLDNSEDGSAWSKQIWGWWNNRDGAVNTWNKGASRSYSSSVADSLNSDYHAAMDPLNSELRAEAFTSFGNFSFTTGTNTVKSGDLVSLDFTEKTFISNNVASKSVNINPFDVIAFNGSVTLSPSSDQWVETKVLPVVNKIVDVKLPDAPARSERVSTGGSGNRFAVSSTTTRTVTNVVGQQTSTLGSSVVDVQYIPYARARNIIGVGSKFKPKARLYPFFENISFSNFVKPLTLIETSDNVGGLFSGSTQETVQFRTGSISGTVVATAQVAIYSPPKTNDPTKRLLSVFNITGTIPSTGFVTAGTKSATVNSVVSYAFGSSLIPDENGLLGFELNLPANTIKTGLRTLRLIDNIDNQQQGSQSAGEANYFAQGTLQSKQETLLTTRSIQNQKITTVTGRYYDPLAQTFNVDSIFNPSGVHVTSVDIYFRTKSDTIPVSLELTRTVNGFPESIITTIPFAVVVKNPEDVSVSENGTVATRFTFPSPIHLVPGEYALALKSNTQDYEVFVSEMGRTDLITKQIIAKQPAMGVLFKSQNGSTWSAFQEEDLKFNLNIAQFASSGVAEFEIDDIEEFRYSYLNMRTSNIVPSDTSISFSYKSLNPGTPSDIMDSDYIPLTTNVDLELGLVKKVDGQGSFILRAELATANPTVSPAIDIEGLGAIFVNNNINTTDISVTDGEEVSVGGNALCRYITRPVTLADGFDSSNIVVTLDAYKPSGTDVRVYYKVSPTESSEPFAFNPWVRMELKDSVPNSSNRFEYLEHKYYPEGAFGSFGIPNDNPIATRFNIVAIKIVLVSDTEAKTPIVRDFRAICLAS
jgi:hypothetical protein